jgi:glutamyl-tRNA reductase
VTLRKLAAEGRAESLLLARELLLDDPDSPSEPK